MSKLKKTFRLGYIMSTYVIRNVIAQSEWILNFLLDMWNTIYSGLKFNVDNHLIYILDILVFIGLKKNVQINSYLRSSSNGYAITTINNSFLGRSFKKLLCIEFLVKLFNYPYLFSNFNSSSRRSQDQCNSF